MARIVQKSNFCKDWYDEEFILWPMPEETASKIADLLNRDAGRNSEHYYAVVMFDYKLYKGMKP